jgi:hypothetical protein
VVRGCVVSVTTAVWKFHIPLDDDSTVEMPRYAQVLHVGLDPADPPGSHARIAVWAYVLTDQPLWPHRFHVRGTGHEVSPARWRQYVGTVIDTPFVWHVFDGEVPV